MKDIIEFKSRYERDFKTIDLTCIQDTRLTWQAKGLHTYMISRPEGWKIRRTDLVNRSKNGRDAVLTAMRELKALNYVYVVSKRNLFGKIEGSVLYVLQKPEDDHEKLEKELNKENPLVKYVIYPNKKHHDTEKPDAGKSRRRGNRTPENQCT